MEEEYIIRNYMVDLVSSLLPDYLAEHFDELGQYSQSLVFTNKLKAMTLNRIPARYITSKKGEVYSAYAAKSHQYSADIMVALSISASELLTELKGST